MPQCYVIRIHTFHLGYKNQSVYAVSGTSRSLFSDKYKTQIQCEQNVQLLNVEPVGASSNQQALKGYTYTACLVPINWKRHRMKRIQKIHKQRKGSGMSFLGDQVNLLRLQVRLNGRTV